MRSERARRGRKPSVCFRAAPEKSPMVLPAIGGDIVPHPRQNCAGRRDSSTPLTLRPAAMDPTDDFDRRHLDAIADADLFPYWYDDVDEPESNPTLVRTESCDLCVVGGGYTGLWTAVIAKERDPSRDVVLIDAAEVGSAASGRNGGFMESSLTHGIANGQERFPARARAARAARPGEPRRHRERHPPLRHRLRLRAHRRHRRRHDRRTPRATSTSCATTPLQLRRLGQDARWLDADAMRAEVDSPTYTGGLWRIGRAALVDPARLAWGLKTAAEQLGVRIYEDTKATGARARRRRRARQDAARPTSGRRGSPSARTRSSRCCAGMRHYIAPVYDYCMVDRAADARAAGVDRLGATARACRTSPTSSTTTGLTEDNRILWGGYDAVYYWRGKVAHELESRPETWAKLSQHFFETFPQLDGVRFSHIWGGAIDTCSRFCVFWGTAMAGRVGLRARLHRARRGVDALRRRGDARPHRRPPQRGHVHRLRARTSRCRSRPSRSASSASRRRAGRSTARTAPASATCGCAPSTASASASTAEWEPSGSANESARRKRSSRSRPAVREAPARGRHLHARSSRDGVAQPHLAHGRELRRLPPAAPAPRHGPARPRVRPGHDHGRPRRHVSRPAACSASMPPTT